MAISTSFPASIEISGAFPIDSRTVIKTGNELSSFPNTITNNTYGGLCVFDIATKRTYMCVVENNKEKWIEINTNPVYFVELQGVQTLEYGLQLLCSKIVKETPGGTKPIATTPLGTTGTIIDTNQVVYRYVYDGNTFVPYSAIGNIGTGGSGGGESGGQTQPVASSNVVLTFRASQDNVATIENITSNNISTKYRSATDTTTIPSGSVADVVFIDTNDNNKEYFRSYVYINNSWVIKCGTQEAQVTLPCYQNWANWTVPNEYVYVPNSNQFIWIRKDNDIQGKVVAFIKNKFGVQFINTQVFKQQSDEDFNDDNVNDYYEQQLLTAIACVDLSNEGYYVRVELAVRESSIANDTDSYRVLLQR